MAAVLRALGVSSRTQAVLAVSQMSQPGRRCAPGARAAPLSAAAATAAPPRRRARQPTRRGRRPAARRRSPLLRDHVRGTYAYMPTSLAGHAGRRGRRRRCCSGGIAPAALMLRLDGARFALVWRWRAWLVGARFSAQRAEHDWPDWRAGCASGTSARWPPARCGASTGWSSTATAARCSRPALIAASIYTFCVASCRCWRPQPRIFLAFVVAVLRAADRARRPSGGDSTAASWPASWLLIIGMTMRAGAQLPPGASQRVIDLKLRPRRCRRSCASRRQAAEAARREAEVANRAKTQFFAAASHDLRQPLHAMGLFAEALRQRVPRARGGAARQQHQRIGRRARRPVLRAARHHPHRQRRRRGARRRLRSSATSSASCACTSSRRAFEKGLALRLRGGQRVVLADPLLVERILRNLVSNAIRYTDDGAVLVSCRQRGDQRAAAGLGHRPGHPRGRAARAIFEEFYQVPGHRRRQPPISARAWAWAWRSSSAWPTLMGAPLRLRSHARARHVFTLELPLGQGAARAGAVACRARGRWASRWTAG